MFCYSGERGFLFEYLHEDMDKASTNFRGFEVAENFGKDNV